MLFLTEGSFFIMAMMLTNDLAVTKVQAMLAQMEQWPHWHEVFLSTRKEYNLSPEEFHHLLPYYMRFMALNAGYSGIGMLSERVDQLWHGHILVSVRYFEFCERFIGKYVHHMPCSSFQLYGISSLRDDSSSIVLPQCKVPDTCMGDPPPSTCYGKIKGESHEETRRSILESTQRFKLAFTTCFGEPPSLEVWDLLKLPHQTEGIAL
jgi:hypothetical protein